MKGAVVSLLAALCATSCTALRREDLPEPVLLEDVRAGLTSGGPRIVGGSIVSSGREFMAHLMAVELDIFGEVVTSGSGIPVYYICGGSVISTDAILTAAHCVDLEPTEPGDIRLRVDYIQVETRISSTQVGAIVDVLTRVVHPGYDDATSMNDIAILLLNETISTTPIDLIFERSSYLAAGNVATAVVVSGWGTTSEGGSASSVLREVAMPVLSNATCNNYYFPFYDEDVMLCAGVVQGGRDSCQGDSGGPLFAEPIGGGREVQIGIVSFGDGCARAGVGGVYTRVAAYESFIRAQTTLATPVPGNGDQGFAEYVYIASAGRGGASSLLALVAGAAAALARR